MLPNNVKTLLFKLADKKEVVDSVVWYLAQYYNGLPENVKTLLFKLADDNKTANSIAYNILESCHMLPEDIRKELLHCCIRSLIK